ncbi:MAG: hypothetical protein EKK64_10215 [Neisseriaceae bacterium]|nr:MAG: hypothetical protein EKK64_10215 [Neisseriaceae bacterium]
MLSELATLLTENDLGQNLFFAFSPDILDITEDITPELRFYFKDSVDFKIVINNSNIHNVLSFLKLTVFAKNMKVLTWNWKNFASYVLSKTGKDYLIDGQIIDLKIIESYSGKKLKSPENYVEAANRLRNIFVSGTWKEIENVYKNLHLPLMTTVIPNIENSGIISLSEGKKVHAYYEIDGQENGRLKCSKAFNSGFCPHAMIPETRESLKGRDCEEFFISFDFKGQEVYQLAWLSNDPLLKKLCELPDIYCGLYEAIMEDKNFDKNKRDFIKKIFLPIIYGQSANMLAQKCGLQQSVAEEKIQKIQTLFPEVFKFTDKYLKQVQEHGFAKDIFGKVRNFEANKAYLVKNFSISSPATVVCLEKLVKLYYKLKNKTDIAFTIHDGYVVYANKENWKKIFKMGHEVLSEDSEFCPGLKLKVSVKAGKNLNDLKTISRKGDL